MKNSPIFLPTENNLLQNDLNHLEIVNVIKILNNTHVNPTDDRNKEHYPVSFDHRKSPRKGDKLGPEFLIQANNSRQRNDQNSGKTSANVTYDSMTDYNNEQQMLNDLFFMNF